MGKKTERYLGIYRLVKFTVAITFSFCVVRKNLFGHRLSNARSTGIWWNIGGLGFRTEFTTNFV
ncbi:hypothetical protein DERF_009506 [Dermatophagoides farinae]|uniref:Uncharacterized protein n=1 Tax=Dermatophagoides farinae TaxID=6954 RepID=A0A922HZA9_DERFA|nr:hypothetical protein DERF_009506 [Dermatophagoides farinae]